jgi:hypothetical protein
MAHKDPVTEEVHRSVLLRDGGCVAAVLDPDHYCTDQWGNQIPWKHLEQMTLDHVQSEYGRMGKRAPSDLDHLVTLCPGAHLRTHWATSHRPALREYLARANRSDPAHG